MEGPLHSHPNAGKKGVVKLSFPYGSDEWYFCYVTVWFIEYGYIRKALENKDTDSIQQYVQLGIFDLCNQVERSRTEMTDVKTDPMQAIFFMAAVDNLADLMTQIDGEALCDTLVDGLKTKIGRFGSGKELAAYYVPMATQVIADVNSHYKTAEFGAEYLRLMWSARK